jgi:addiction module RelE/StbE family toxin
MAKVIWTEPALQDLDQIADYISLDNTITAKKLVRKSLDQVKYLKQHPKLGRSVPELNSSVYRELTVSPCRIFYRIENDKIFIIHVKRSEQLLRLKLLKSR